MLCIYTPADLRWSAKEEHRKMNSKLVVRIDSKKKDEFQNKVIDKNTTMSEVVNEFITNYIDQDNMYTLNKKKRQFSNAYKCIVDIYIAMDHDDYRNDYVLKRLGDLECLLSNM